MRLHDDDDFTTLTWVKPELDETLRQARTALQVYVEEGEDLSQLRDCSSLLHQAQGTLRMVELYGAAMVAEEMEQLAKALIDGRVAERDNAFAILMQGIMQLPDYLERLQSGHRDIPIVLLPLLNQLRELRGEKGLAESVLFSPDLSRPLPPTAKGPATPLPADELHRRADTLRNLFQSALLRWLKDDSSRAAMRDLTDVCEQLVPITSAESARRLFWVAAGTLDALANHMFPVSAPLKLALAKVEQEIKRLADAGDGAFRTDPPIDLTKQLLYFIAQEGIDKGRLGEIRKVFGLGENAPSDAELAHARGSLAGHNRALLETVTGAIKEDLLRVKDALDLHMRTPGESPAGLSVQIEALDRIADTLGMLGLIVPRRVVQEQRNAIDEVLAGNRPNDEATLLDIAGALLYVETSLDNQVEYLGQGGVESERSASQPSTEARQLLEVLVKEAIANFTQARQCFVAFIETHWDHAQLADVPRLLEEVSGAMRILEITEPSLYLIAVRRYTENELLRRLRVPNSQQMDRLADVLSSLEYFLEALRDRRPHREQILEVAQQSLEALGYWPLPADDKSVPPLPVLVKPAPSIIVSPTAAPAPTKVPETSRPDTPAPVHVVTWQMAELAQPAPIVVPVISAADAAVPVAEATPAVAVAAAIPGFDRAGNEEIDEEIRAVFLEEFEEEISNLKQQLPAWHAAPDNMELLRPIRRVFHTLKGSGRLVGAKSLGELSWKLEILLNRILDGSRVATPAVIALVDHAFDVLPRIRAALQGESAYADLQGIQSACERLIAGEEVAYVPSTAPAQPLAEVVDDVMLADHPTEVAVEPAHADIAAVDEDVAAPLPISSMEEEAEAETSTASDDSFFAIDEVLFEILKPEVAGHMETVDAWLASCSARGPQPVTEPLLRAMHTMNGAFAMTEVLVITQVTSPVEGFIKRSLAHHVRPNHDGVALLADAAQAIRQTIIALDQPRPQLPNFTGLALRAISLRDTLPEATQPTIPMHPEEEDSDMLPQAVALEAPDVSAIPQFDAEHVDAIAVDTPKVVATVDHDVVEPVDAMPDEQTDTSATDFAELPSETELLSLDEFLRSDAGDVAAFEVDEADVVSDQAPAEIESELAQSAAGTDAASAGAALVESYAETAAAPDVADVEPADEAVVAVAMQHVADADDALAAMILAYSAETASVPIAPIADVTQSTEEVAAQPAMPVTEQQGTPTLEPTFALEDSELVEAASVVDTSVAIDADALEPTNDGVPEDYYGLSLDELEAMTAPTAEEVAADSAELASLDQQLPEIEPEPLPTQSAESPTVETHSEDVDLTELPIIDATPAVAEIDTLALESEALVELDEEAEGLTDASPTFVDQSAVFDADITEEILPEVEISTDPEVEATPAEEQDETIQQARPVVPLADDPKDPELALDTTDLDSDLLDMFLEESNDILDHSDGVLASLRNRKNDRELIISLQRDLHTIKGGARMAGIYAVGDLGHAMESLLESVAENRRELNADGIVVLERGFDRLQEMVARIGERKAIALPAGLIAQVEALARGKSLTDLALETAQKSSEPSEPSEQAPATTPTFVPAPLKPLSAPIDLLDEEDEFISLRAPQEQVRIRADLLDRLVNYAGEVAIYRARLEQQLGAFRSNLGELNQTTTRLREQLRRLDIETEAQISARYMREQDSIDSDFDPLELDRFTNQQQLSRALAESANDLVNLQGVLDDLTRQYETLLLQQSRVSSDLQEGLMRTRMVPFDALVPRLRRVLRQAASDTGKLVQLKVDGASGEMDRNVLDRMTAPLEHMLRNSMAHGLELPQDRRKAKKPEEGLVRIAVQREGSEVVLKVSDDGAGLNREAIRRKAIERGLLKPDIQVSDEDLFAMILESGFSTAETVSRLAGRGVGMDVVYSEIRQLGGTLVIQSSQGKGTEFIVRLPFTLAVTQAVFVKIGDTSFAVPIASVQGVSRIVRTDLDKLLASDNPVFNYAGEDYVIYDLGHLLGHAPARAQDSVQMPLLLARSGTMRAAISVDQVLGSREVVVKPTGPQVSSVPGIFGATIMGDGRVVMIVDVAPLLRRHSNLIRNATPAGPATAVAVHRVPVILVVDDSITMRKVTGRVLERNNMEVITARDGVDAVERMAERVPDLVLLDIEMPRMDGYEVAQNMRSDPRLKDVPIIMITSRTGDKHRQRAMDIGVNRYLGKPYQENELMRNVYDMLGREPADV